MSIQDIRLGLKIGLKVFLLLALLGNASIAHAQSKTTEEIEQIAKLEILLKELQQGYAIVQKGLTTIAQIKKGDLDLHSLFFSSLSTVNPAIKNWGKVGDIIAMQVQIILGCTTTASQIVSSGYFNASDLTYVQAVYSNLKDLTVKDIDELTGILTDGQWQMSDDQRMSRIDQLFLRVSSKYTFLRSFADRILNQIQLRTQEKGSLQNLGKLF
jgi:hypothetical protein